MLGCTAFLAVEHNCGTPSPRTVVVWLRLCNSLGGSATYTGGLVIPIPELGGFSALLLFTFRRIWLHFVTWCAVGVF